VRSEEAERRCVAYDDRPEAWCKSFSEGKKKKKRRQRGVALHMMTAPRLGVRLLAWRAQRNCWINIMMTPLLEYS
jgi:hypothetical protein